MVYFLFKACEEFCRHAVQTAFSLHLMRKEPELNFQQQNYECPEMVKHNKDIR